MVLKNNAKYILNPRVSAIADLTMNFCNQPCQRAKQIFFAYNAP